MSNAKDALQWAMGGTDAPLFLDEIGELPLSLQVKLLGSTTQAIEGIEQYALAGGI